MKIHIDAKVVCGEELCGRVSCLIIDPFNDEITHLVVTKKRFPLPPNEYLVPLEHVVSADQEKVVLDFPADELSKMESFITHEFVPSETIIQGYGSEYLRKPTVLMTQVEREITPVGELAIHQGAKVFTKKEQIGTVDDFIVSSKDVGHITHLVLRKGHLWAAKNITIPVSEIESIDEKGIHLKLGKEEVEALPSMKIHGWFK